MSDGEGAADARAAGQSAAEGNGVGGSAVGEGGTPGLGGVDLARAALRAAREQALARGADARQRRQVRRGGSLRSGARPGGRDPVPLGAAVARLSSERGWEAPLAVGGVIGRWREVVGVDLAQHCVPLGYDEAAKVLTVRCDSTAWATQVRLLLPQLLGRVNGVVGEGSVRSIRVLGPSGGGPGQGRGRGGGGWRAPGSRGPGDTYG
ncbi:DUF721 domain-containing protein [Streptomyces sp. 4N509B]|uniref:DUF721 domain-containing protein n=1 Tax=Streptomyces sp. 4N509B TaxID=3457413 RepID=UPI003FD3DCBF